MRCKKLLDLDSRIEIDREESTCIKGLLMILIILGHNYMISNYSCHNMIFFWLYCFHVHMFFILPLYYKNKSKPIHELIKKNVLKLYIPYIWFYCFFFVIYTHFYDIKLDLIVFLKGLVPISIHNISNAVGVKYLWFIPVFLLYSIIIPIYKKINNKFKWYIVSLAILGYIAKTFYQIDIILITTLSYLAISVLVYLIFKKPKGYTLITSSGIFILLSILFFLKVNLHYLYLLSYPIFFWGTLLFLKGYIKKIKIFYQIGQFSFPIYMIHFFINSIFEKLFKFSLTNGLFSFIATIAISYYIVYFLSKYPKFYNIIFPK